MEPLSGFLPCITQEAVIIRSVLQRLPAANCYTLLRVIRRFAGDLHHLRNDFRLALHGSTAAGQQDALLKDIIGKFRRYAFYD